MKLKQNYPKAEDITKLQNFNFFRGRSSENIICAYSIKN